MEPTLRVVSNFWAAKDAWRLRAGDAIRLFEEGRLSPEILLASCQDRIARRDRSVGAWAYVQPQASAAAPHGPLHGLPIGVKDCIDTGDMPTSYGSPIYAGHRPACDAEVVEVARQAGALVVGKTETAEFAYLDPPRTTNPLDSSRSPGGSSSGSAAAVADGMVPLAIGTQTGGSIIRPAAYCGIVGFKPSFGAVSSSGVRSLASSIDTVGVFARCVSDASLFSSVLAKRPDWHCGSLPQDIRLGIVDLDGVLARHDAVNLVVIAVQRAGGTILPIDLPFPFREIDAHAMTIVHFEAYAALAHERKHHLRKLSSSIAALVTGTPPSEGSYCAALTAMEDTRKLVDAVFGEVDALLLPSALDEAPVGLGSTGDSVMNRIWSALCMPCISLPAGTGPTGMPLGAQLVGRRNFDRDLLRTATRVEELLSLMGADREQ